MLKFSNFGKALVASAPVGTTGLSFTVEAGRGLNFPALAAGDYFYGIFKDASGNNEVVKIESRATDSLQIAVGGRGLDGTTARTWLAGDYFVAGLVNASLQELFNSTLTSLGLLPSSANQMAYFSAPSVMSLTGLTAFSRTLLDDEDAAAARATLGATMIPLGTVMAFFQAAAPVGWTQVATHDNKSIRIVSGAGGGSGGSVAFTAAFTSQAVTGSNAAVALTTAQIPSHQHLIKTTASGSASAGVRQFVDAAGVSTGGTEWEGGGGTHNHTFTGNAINLAVQYIDMILARKD